MICNMATRRILRIHVLLIALILTSGAATAVRAQSGTALTVTGSVEKPLTLSLADLQRLPRKTVKIFDSHEGKEQTYEGVALSELLARAGVPQGEKIRGGAMATYIEAQGADGYRVIYALAETDSSFQEFDILVADKLDGQPMGTNLGPLRLVNSRDKRPARWVRMLQSIKVVTVPKSTP
jgi:DMSO/TMAO reductase YedYZ molybdopterin-dependent catalytic subunit